MSTSAFKKWKKTSAPLEKRCRNGLVCIWPIKDMFGCGSSTYMMVWGHLPPRGIELGAPPPPRKAPAMSWKSLGDHWGRPGPPSGQTWATQWADLGRPMGRWPQTIIYILLIQSSTHIYIVAAPRDWYMWVTRMFTGYSSTILCWVNVSCKCLQFTATRVCCFNDAFKCLYFPASLVYGASVKRVSVYKSQLRWFMVREWHLQVFTRHSQTCLLCANDACKSLHATAPGIYVAWMKLASV